MASLAIASAWRCSNTPRAPACWCDPGRSATEDRAMRPHVPVLRGRAGIGEGRYRRRSTGRLIELRALGVRLPRPFQVERLLVAPRPVGFLVLPRAAHALAQNLAHE